MLGPGAKLSGALAHAAGLPLDPLSRSLIQLLSQAGASPSLCRWSARTSIS